ncbi:MAG: hypothetical protein KAW17_03450 [Candidatus Eisenbacteria sp.]|nr:hypothetical protein [Candidatus Eisenbacteria bacterium]
MILRKNLPVALACLAICLTSAPVLAQLSDNLGGLTDANVAGFLGPLNAGLSGTMNSAIFRTGNVPAVGINFSIGLAAMAIGYDDEDKTYLPTDPPGFTSLVSTRVPTVIGDPTGVIVEGQSSLAQLYPGGFNLDGFEIAVPELSIGSIFGTRVLVRYIALDLGDSEFGEFKYIGYGAQHSISQWLPLLPVDLAAGFFMQGFEIGNDVVKASATHFNVTASKQFAIFQPYVGLGYDSIELDAKYVDEDYPDLSFDLTLDNETNMHLTTGLLVKLTPVQVFVELNSGAATGIALGLHFGM